MRSSPTKISCETPPARTSCFNVDTVRLGNVSYIYNFDNIRKIFPEASSGHRKTDPGNIFPSLTHYSSRFAESCFVIFTPQLERPVLLELSKRLFEMDNRRVVTKYMRNITSCLILWDSIHRLDTMK